MVPGCSLQGQPLGPELRLPEDPVPVYSRPIPPHTGYGSEEDTLKNCFRYGRTASGIAYDYGIGCIEWYSDVIAYGSGIGYIEWYS